MSFQKAQCAHYTCPWRSCIRPVLLDNDVHGLEEKTGVYAWQFIISQCVGLSIRLWSYPHHILKSNNTITVNINPLWLRNSSSPPTILRESRSNREKWTRRPWLKSPVNAKQREDENSRKPISWPLSQHLARCPLDENGLVRCCIGSG